MIFGSNKHWFIGLKKWHLIKQKIGKDNPPSIVILRITSFTTIEIICFDPKAREVRDFLVGVPQFGFYMIIVICLKFSRDKWSAVFLHNLAQWYYFSNKRLFMKT